MYYKLKAMSKLFGDSASNELRSMLIYDAMTPEFKAANAELLKAIKMNDKSDALPHSDLEAINKAMKSNDAAKVGEGLKKVQLKLKDAEKKLNEDLKEAIQKFSESQKVVEGDKEKSKQAKATQQLFAKVKSLAEGVKTSPKNESKLATLTEKLKQYGDLSGKLQKVIQLTSKGKDATKQIEMLVKAVDAAEKKFIKSIATSGKELKKNADSFAALKDRVKICKDKLAAFQKERLFIANVVKQMPHGDLRQKSEKESDVVSLYAPSMSEAKILSEELGTGSLNKNYLKKAVERKVILTREKEKDLLEKLDKTLRDAFFLKKRFVSEVNDALKTLGSGFVDYEKTAKRLVWKTKEAFDQIASKEDDEKKRKKAEKLSVFFKRQYGNTDIRSKKDLINAIEEAESKSKGNDSFLKAISQLKKFVINGEIDGGENRLGLSNEQLKILSSYKNDESGMFIRLLGMSPKSNKEFETIRNEFMRLVDQLHARGVEFKKRVPELSDYLNKNYPYKSEWIIVE